MQSAAQGQPDRQPATEQHQDIRGQDRQHRALFAQREGKDIERQPVELPLRRGHEDGAEIVDLEASTRTQIPNQTIGDADEITQTSFRLAGPAPILDPETTS